MEYQGFTEKRRLKVVQENYDLVVVGGGLTGVCCAITACLLYTSPSPRDRG